MAGEARRGHGRRRRLRRLLLLALSGGLVVGILAAVPGAPASSAAVVTLPDLQILVPTNDISIGASDTGARQLQFTHVTWDAGAGPFLITPKPNRLTGLSSFTQTIYQSSTAGHWRPKYRVPIAVQGVFDPPSDYRLPLTRFTLDAANPDGSPGAVVATSPKTDYCITADAYVGGVPHTPSHTSPPQAHCAHPKATLGFSVGWGDQYDQTDNGQPIDLTGIADGTYVLQATVDPQHVFTESDTGNDVVDTTLAISGTTVTVLGQGSPNRPPPTVVVTSPTAGASLSGAVTLQVMVSATAPATVASVQYLLDGQPIGAPVTAAPFSLSWDTVSTFLGAHTVSAQATDSTGTTGTSAAVAVTVTSGGTNGLSLDASMSKTGSGAVTVSGLTTGAAGDTLLAFVSADGPAGSGQQAAVVSSPTMSWQPLVRENHQSGDSEIWTATTTGASSGASVSATLVAAGYDMQLSVLAFRSSAGPGAAAVASGASGAPAVGLATTSAGSLSLAVGEDWDHATGRVVGAGQSLLDQWVDTGTGDTFWLQGTTSPSTGAAQALSLADTAPTTDQWNMAAVEVVPAASPPPAAPVVYLGTPALVGTLSGTAHLVASVTDDAPISSVQFLVDGAPAGPPVTKAPFAAPWDTASVPPGTHLVSAVATNPAGQQGRAPAVAVTTRNPAPPMTCFVMGNEVHADGTGAATTRPFHTAAPDETLVAFVTASGHGASRTRVSGAGLRWHLVRAASVDGETAAVWRASAPAVLAGVRVTARGARGTGQHLSVVAMEGVDGVGAAAAASGPGGEPGLTLATTRRTSLVFAVGRRSAGAAPGQAPGWARLGSGSHGGTGGGGGGAWWVQYTNVPTGPGGSLVTVHDPGPAGAPWAMVAVELVSDGG